MSIRNSQVDCLEYVLSAANDRIKAQFSNEIKRHGATIEYWRILSFLQTGHGRTMGELAEYAQLSLPTATRVVDKMVTEALIYRAPSPEDRRKVLVHVSDKGRQTWADIKPAADSYYERVEKQFGEDWMAELIKKLEHLMSTDKDAPAEKQDGS